LFHVAPVEEVNTKRESSWFDAPFVKALLGDEGDVVRVVCPNAGRHITKIKKTISARMSVLLLG